MVAALLAGLEAISRTRPDRVLRLRGELPYEPSELVGSELVGPEQGEPEQEPFELLIFRGFSSSVSHPTAFDPDQPALPESARIHGVELLQGPLNPAEERVVSGPWPAEHFLDPGAWA